MRIIKKIGKSYFIRKFKACGINPRFNPLNTYIDYHNVTLGDNVFINMNGYISGLVHIGNDTLIGPNVIIIDGSGYHQYEKIGQLIRNQGRGKDSSILIGNDCWIAAGVVVLSGVSIGDGAIIGASSVVTKPMPPFTICFGSPCEPKKYRYSDDELKEHLSKMNKSDKYIDYIIVTREREFRKFNPEEEIKYED